MSQVTIETSASLEEKIAFVKKQLNNNNSQFNTISATCEMLAVKPNDFLASISEQGLNNLLAKCKALALKKMPSNKVLVEYEKLSKFNDLENARFKNSDISKFLDSNSYSKDKENFKRFTIDLKLLVSQDFSLDQQEKLFQDIKNLIANL